MNPLGISVVRADESYGYAKYYYYDGPTVYIEVTAIDSSDNKWRIRGRESWGDKEVYLSGKGVGTFSFDSDDNYSYIFQIQNWNGDWVNTTNAYGDTEENSIINVNFDSSSGGDGWEDDGGGSGTGGGPGGGYGSGSGTLYFDATQYGAEYAVEYSYDSDTFYIDNVQVKLTQYASVWWGFNLTVKINGLTISSRSSSHLIDTFDWYDLNISGSADITDKVEVTLTGSAIHGNYQFNVASPTTQTVVISDDGDDDWGDDGESSTDLPYYILIRQGEGTKLTVTRTYVDNDAYYNEGDYIGELVNGELFEDEYGTWYKYRAWNDDYFTIEAEALPGYTIDTHYDKDGFMWYYAVSGMEYNVGYDGNSAWNFDPQDFGEVARIYTTATKNDSSDNGSSAKKGAYIGIDNVARKINKMYIGINGVARKIKKAYIGIGGVARPCWSGGIKYYGTITDLSYGRERMGATHVGNYALFGGGSQVSNATDNGLGIVDAYNTSLSRMLATELSASNIPISATHNDDYALFCMNKSYQNNVINAYDIYLTRTEPIELNYATSPATHVGDYVLFCTLAPISRSITVHVFNAFLTEIYTHSFETYYSQPSATHVGNYALFGGGEQGSGYSSNVYALGTSLTVIVPNEKLSVERCHIGATHVGNYALFGGGLPIGSNSCSTIDAYSASLTKFISPPGLSIGRVIPATTNVGDYALFGGGDIDQNSKLLSEYLSVDVYDIHLIRTTIPTPIRNLHKASATHVGDYALIGGGNANSSTVCAFVTF